MSRPPSIRVLFGVVLALVVALGAALVAVTILQRRTATERTDAEHQRVTSFALSDQMRQSSNDLTRMVRLYVTTGEPRYRRYYDQILAIRSGTAPRPRTYDSAFWDRVLADGEGGVASGPPTSLTTLMRRADFVPGELAALGASLQASDNLARVERRVMRAVAPRIAQGTGGSYLADVAPQYRLLVDGAYHRDKRDIMTAITRFIALVDARTADRSAALQTRTDRLLLAQTAILALLAVAVLGLLLAASRLIARPLGRLTAVTRRIAAGDSSARAPSEGVAELRRLAADFNGMTAAIETELARRRSAEREALESGDRLQEIADRVPGSVFQFHVDVDDALSVRFASRDGSVHGVEANAGVDFSSVARAVLADDRGAWLDSMVGAARAGGNWQHEYRVHSGDGDVAWMQAHAVGRPAGDGSGELYGYVTDISERKALEADLRRAREEAEAADRAKSAFLAMVSHELRTPLVAVSGTLEVLALSGLDEEQRSLVEVAMRSTRSLLALIGDVLDFSKIEAGHLDLVVEPVALGPLVADLAAQHRQRAENKGLTVTTDVDGALAPAVAADALRLRQVIGNLLANAIKFTERGGIDLRVVVLADEGTLQRVAISVRDTGIGIGPEDQQRLFQPFTQAVTGDEQRRDGTGLGLVLSQQLVDAMGGTVTLSSTLGAGTTLRIELPLVVCAEPVGTGAEVAPAAPARPLPSRAEAEREGSVLLLVEDHPVSRDILARQFRAIGFHCDVAASAEDALELFARHRYGLVFCDIRLPGQDGYGLAGAIRRHEEGHGLGRTPLVALTASALRGERERCRGAGMDDLVVKPAPLAVMEASLRRWLPHLAWAGPAPGAPSASASASPSSADLELEPDVLEELTAGNGALREQILTGYLASLRDDVAALHAALADGDLDGARRRAHQIAGASRTVGAYAVARSAALVERCRGGAEELRPLASALAEHAGSGRR